NGHPPFSAASRAPNLGHLWRLRLLFECEQFEGRQGLEELVEVHGGHLGIAEPPTKNQPPEGQPQRMLLYHLTVPNQVWFPCGCESRVSFSRSPRSRGQPP